MEQELTPSPEDATTPRDAERRSSWLRRPSLHRRHLRMVGRIALGVLVVIVAFFALTPVGRYLLRAGWEEGKILARRQSIVALVTNSATPPAVREKLRLVLAARGFAADSVGLLAKQSFTTYSKLDRDTLVLVLSGAYRDQLKAYSWWFPIVGRVPYKGYFDFGAARKAARSLDADGFDVYLRPSPAFSTLGWFNDPLLTTSLRADSLDLAETVIHELTHNTFYAPGQAVFNESFANFVGARGAAWFLRSRGDSAAAEEEDARWSDERTMARFWASLYRTMDSAFKAHPGDANRQARLTARDTVYAHARQELVHVLGPQLRTIGPRVVEHMRLDNAALMARRIYLTDIDLFEGVYARENYDLRRTIGRVVQLAKSRPKDPYGALRDWLVGGKANPSSLPGSLTAEARAQRGA